MVYLLEVVVGQRRAEYRMQVLEEPAAVSCLDSQPVDMIEAVIAILYVKLVADHLYQAESPRVVFAAGDKGIVALQTLFEHESHDVKLQKRKAHRGFDVLEPLDFLLDRCLVQAVEQGLAFRGVRLAVDAAENLSSVGPGAPRPS